MSRNIVSIALVTIMAITAMFVCTTVYGVNKQGLPLSPSFQIAKNESCDCSIAQGSSYTQTSALAPSTYTKSLPVFTALKSGMDYNIYADNKLFLTVTYADAQANGTTPGRLASIWVKRLNSTLPSIVSIHQPSEMQSSSVLIPRDTVIRATLNKPLSSATSKVGDRFYAYQQGVVAGGFPEKTKFTGKIVSVIRASGNMAGQIGILFVSARLPDGKILPIEGQLISLDEHSVMMDEGSGRLMGKDNAQVSNGTFIASGAGAGLAIGQSYGNNPFLGAVLGGSSSSLYSQQQVMPAVGQDARVPAGTAFGILLDQDVTWTSTPPTAPEYYVDH